MTMILDEQSRRLIARIKAIQEEIQALQKNPDHSRESAMYAELHTLLDDVGNTITPLDWPDGSPIQ